MGDIEQKIVQSLKYAGWYPDRKTDISKIEEYYEKFGIKSRWYIEVFNLDWAADFTFELFPYIKSHAIDVVDFMYDDAEYTIKSEEYESVLDFATEDDNLVMVGEIGYYYPARVWIGESGKLYATHDYDEEVLVFDSIVQLIGHEVKGREFSTIAMK